MLAKNKRAKVTKARVSSTDPDAKVMKMPNGGFNPAYNLEAATDVDSQVIVGVGVVTKGSDGGQALPMVEQIKRRLGEAAQASGAVAVAPGQTLERPEVPRAPEATETPKVLEGYLIDGGFATREDITEIEGAKITVYAPTRLPPNHDQRTEPSRRQTRRYRRGCSLAGEDGDRSGQGGLQGTSGDGRVCQCPPASLWSPAVVGSRPGQGAERASTYGDRAQPLALDRTRGLSEKGASRTSGAKMAGRLSRPR